MPISFKCPGCAKDYTVADDCAGRTTRCLQCRTDIIVPGADRPALDDIFATPGPNVEDATKILPKRAAPDPSRPQAACLVHIYPTGPSLGTRYPLGQKPMTLGRDQKCDICLDDESVSRNHCRIQPNHGGYSVGDLQSTNGTFVNDTKVSQCQLKDGDYLRIGTGIYRFLAGGNVEAEYHEEIYRLKIIDALTDIYNKRYFEDFLGRALSTAIRYHRPLSLVMLDIDRFKSVNDELGHLAGDYALRELAGLVKKEIRKDDLFARFGGEEFVIVMPETVRQDAVGVAEHIRKTVELHSFQYAGSRFHLTVSMGVTATSGENWLAPSDFIRQADDNLYQGKHQGRNRVVG